MLKGKEVGGGFCDITQGSLSGLQVKLRKTQILKLEKPTMELPQVWDLQDVTTTERPLGLILNKEDTGL